MRAVAIEQFPGLDLRADPGDSPGALDAWNVTIEQGRVRSRDGMTELFVTTGAPMFAQISPAALSSNTALIVAAAGSPGNLYAVNTSGVSVGVTTLLAVSNAGASGVAIGTPSASYFYVTNQLSVPKRWDGATWTAPAGFPLSIKAFGLSPTDNRLVTCVGSKVAFSDAGAPETFGAKNHVMLTPGDGEEIRGTAVFNNQLFVFKKTKFFVFYGNSVDGTGQPVFNYRTVNAGIGMHVNAAQSVCVGPDAVYFIANDGIYRTTGGLPVKMSQALDPFFVGDTNLFWAGGSWLPGLTQQRLAWLDDRLYVSTGAGIFVWDARLGAWSAWSQAATALAVFPRSNVSDTTNTLAVGTTKMLRMDSAATTDDGDAIVSRYRTAFEGYGQGGEKRLRETILDGTGGPTVQWSHDWGAPVAGSTVTLGTAPAVNDGRQSLAMIGRSFSLKIGASSGAWSVNRVQVNFASEGRPAGVSN